MTNRRRRRKQVRAFGVPVEVCEARVLLSATTGSEESAGEEDAIDDYDTYYAEMYAEQYSEYGEETYDAPSFEQYGSYDYYDAAANSPLADDVAEYEEEYYDYEEYTEDLADEAYDEYSNEEYEYTDEYYESYEGGLEYDDANEYHESYDTDPNDDDSNAYAAYEDDTETSFESVGPDGTSAAHDVPEDATDTTFPSNDEEAGDNELAEQTADHLDSFLGADDDATVDADDAMTSGDATDTNESTPPALQAPTAFQLDVSALSLSAVRDDLFSVQPDGTGTFSSVTTSQSTSVENALGGDEPAGITDTNAAPVELTNDNTVLLEQTYNSPTDWTVTQSVTNSWRSNNGDEDEADSQESPAMAVDISEVNGDETDDIANDDGESPKTSGSESFSITVVNGTTTITTYSISTSSSSASGDFANMDDDADPPSIPQSWIEAATTSITSEDKSEIEEEDSPDGNDNPDVPGPEEESTPPDSDNPSSDDGADDGPASGNAFNSSSDLTITTTETLITKEDGTTGTQTVTSIVWSSSFSWQAGDSITLGKNSSTDDDDDTFQPETMDDVPDGGSAADDPLADLVVSGTYTYTAFASGSVAGSFSVTTFQPSDGTVSGTLAGAVPSVSYSFAVSAMAGGTTSKMITASMNNSSGSADDGTDEHLIVDYVDESESNSYVGFSFGMGNAPASSDSSGGGGDDGGGPNEDSSPSGGGGTAVAAAAVVDTGGDEDPAPDGPPTDGNEEDDNSPPRPKSGQSSASDAVSGGISGVSIGFDANSSSSSTTAFSYAELKRPFDPAQWGDGYSDETYSDFQHRESESHISLGVGGDSTHFELGWSSSGNTNSSVETDNYSLGRYMYEDDYMEMWDRISYSNVSDFSNEFNIGFGDVEDAGIVNESSFNVSIKDEVESHIDYDGWFSTVTETFIYRDSSDDEKHETQDTDSDSQPVTEMQNPDDDTGPEEDDSSPIHLHKTTYAENDSVEVIIHFEGVPGQGDDTGDTQDSSDTDGPTTLPDGPNDEDSTESDDTDAPDETVTEFGATIGGNGVPADGHVDGLTNHVYYADGSGDDPANSGVQGTWATIDPGTMIPFPFEPGIGSQGVPYSIFDSPSDNDATPCGPYYDDGGIEGCTIDTLFAFDLVRLTGRLAAAAGRGTLRGVGTRLAPKGAAQLKDLTRGRPWAELWGSGTDDAVNALSRLRKGENILPDGIGRENLEAYLEIAKRALANPKKATDAARPLQEARVKIIEELLRGLR